MAKYSYTSGMEDRGLDWLFIPIQAQLARNMKAGLTTVASKAISEAFQQIFGTNGYSCVILENQIVPDGRGGYYIAIYFYNQRDSRRLESDNIRFHDGAQDLPATFKP
jgi:hypothetical protein